MEYDCYLLNLCKFTVMSRLSNLYKAMETLRKGGLSLSEDLEKQVRNMKIDNLWEVKICTISHLTKVL